MKKSSQTQAIDLSKRSDSPINRTQIYLAVTFIYLYFITAIFF